MEPTGGGGKPRSDGRAGQQGQLQWTRSARVAAPRRCGELDGRHGPGRRRRRVGTSGSKATSPHGRPLRRIDGTDVPGGHTGEPELDSTPRCRAQRGWKRRHLGGGGSSTSREPAAREPPPLAGWRRGLRVPELVGGVAGRDGLRAGTERGTPDGRAFGPGRPGDLRKRGRLRADVDRGSSRGRGSKPHGREWLKQVTGSGGDQAVKVAKNGEGGRRGCGSPRRGRLPSAADSFEARRSRPGHGSPGLGASEGRETPREDGRAEHPVVVNRAGGTDGVEVEVLEGERKATSGEPIAQATAR